MKQPPKSYEFRSKPAWQRLVIMLGGVTVNFLLGFLIYGLVLWGWGKEYLPAENARYGIAVDSLGTEMGLRDGDQILAVGGKPFDKFSDRIVVREIIINDADRLTVRRDGEQKQIDIPEKFVRILSSYENKDKRLFVPRIPFVIQQAAKDMPAAKAGMQQGDSVIALNGESTPYFQDFLKKVQNYKGKEISVTAIRGERDTMNFNLTTTPEGIIGVRPYGPARYFDTERQTYTLAQALPAGTVEGWNILVTQVKAIGQIFKGKIKASDSLGGFGSIGQMFGGQWQWERFWTMTAILSLILAFMNLLPIPALDGGHVMFLLYEVVSGRKPSDRFVEVATMLGFILVIGLVLYVNGLDILRGIFG